jgi:hypothetical protein
MPKVLFNQDAIDLVMQICTNAERYRWSHAGSEDQITVDTLKATASLLAHRTEQQETSLNLRLVYSRI